MSDKNNSTTSTDDELYKMREAFMISFNNIYGQLLEFLRRLNFNPILKSHGLMNLDQGAYWIRQAISYMEINIPTPLSADNIKVEDVKVQPTE